MNVLYAYAAAIEAGPLPSEFDADVEFLELGVGKTASTFVLTERLQREPKPELLVLFGVCGVHAGAALEVGDLCLVSVDCLADEGVQTETGFVELEQLLLQREFELDLVQTARAAAILAGVPVVKGSTVSTCSGNDATARDLAERTGAATETMEGAAVALVCRRSSVAMVQLRSVSNRTGNRELGGWDLAAACTSLQGAVRKLIAGLEG